jgi:hypothetical protein
LAWGGIQCRRFSPDRSVRPCIFCINVEIIIGLTGFRVQRARDEGPEGRLFRMNEGMVKQPARARAED